MASTLDHPRRLLSRALPAARRSARVGLILSLGLGLGLGAWACKRGPAPVVKQDPNTPVEVRGVTLDEKTVDISEDFANQPVLLSVWASWCGPCKREMPTLVNIERRQREVGQGLAVVGINVDAPGKLSQAKDVASRYDLGFPNVADPHSRIAEMLGASSLPTTVLLDRQHKVVWRHQGQFKADSESFRMALHKALSEDPNGQLANPQAPKKAR